MEREREREKRRNKRGRKRRREKEAGNRRIKTCVYKSIHNVSISTWQEERK